MVFWNIIIPLELLILSITVPESKSEKALIIEAWSMNARFKDLGTDLEEKFTQILTVCPASTQQEIEFNEKVSLSGNSLFSRRYYQKSEHMKNIKQDICDKPFKPAMIYDFECGEYEIGYEIYYEDGEEIKLTRKGNETYYYRYRPVKSTENQTRYEVLNPISPPSDLVMRYEDGQKLPNVKFNFTDGSQTLVFHWLPVLNIKLSGDNKRITSDLSFWHSYWHGTYNLHHHCKDYDSTDQNIYSEKNQEIHLKDILTSPVSQKDPKPLSCGQAYGCLVNSQIAPLQYYQTHAERFASCSHLNMIPVWKTIAENQLRKVDVYTMAIDRPVHPYKVFGVSGVLKMKKTNSEPQEIFLSDSTTQKIIQVPKIIYRILSHHCLRRLRYSEDPSQIVENRYAAAIIIHNDPSPIPDDDRLCSKESAISGWDRITNEDPRTGLTYVCPMTMELNDKLRVYDNMTSDTFEPFNMSAVPYSYLNHWDPKQPIFYQNYTSDIEKEFEAVWQEEFAQNFNKPS